MLHTWYCLNNVAISTIQGRTQRTQNSFRKMVHFVLFLQQSGTSNASSLWWYCSSPCVPNNCPRSQSEILAKAKPFGSGVDLNNFWNIYFLKSSNVSILAVVQTKKTDRMGNLWDMKSLHQYWIALFWYVCSNLDQHLKHVQVTRVHVAFHVLPKEPKSFILVNFNIFPNAMWLLELSLAAGLHSFLLSNQSAWWNASLCDIQH